ncbi:MAG: purine-nucleoside phosphorylase [bacterium]|nr:purine-nucleoside phosphorylase [bacterium]
MTKQLSHILAIAMAAFFLAMPSFAQGTPDGANKQAEHDCAQAKCACPQTHCAQHAQNACPTAKRGSEHVLDADSEARLIDEAVSFIRTKTDIAPEVALVLGSGFDAIWEEAKNPVHISYRDIPGFVPSTAPGHTGELVFGTIEGHKVCIMRGRLHLYEGYKPWQVIFPIRVLNALGAKTIIITNASGAIANDLALGDLMLIKDHINMMGVNPCAGPHTEKFGARFFPVSCYDGHLMKLARNAAETLGIKLPEGVYVAMSGPSYETRAENRMLAILGGDVVGMSTVPEIIAAAQCGMKVLGFSCITDVLNDEDSEDMEQAVIEAGNRACDRLTKMLRLIIKELP